MLPEIDTYLKTLADTLAEYHRVLKGAKDSIWSNTWDLRREAIVAKDKAQDDAWDLLKQSDDKLVVWIAEHCGDYRGYAQAILEELPMSLDAMDKMAEDGAWCNVWSNLRRQALADGVVEQPPGYSAASENLIVRVTDENDVPLRSEVLILIEALLAERMTWLIEAGVPAEQAAVIKGRP